MSTTTGIQWTDTTWNPVRGCRRVSAGCMNCYAERVALRFSGAGQPYEGLVTRTTLGSPRWTGTVRLVPSLLDAPLHWKKPRRVFVNSMSDLFHEDVPDDFIESVWNVMAKTSAPSCGRPHDGHTYQILTKRPERMLRVVSAIYGRSGTPLPNVWLGVSVEDQSAADARIPLLLQTPAAARFISAEPLLGPVDFSRWLDPTGVHCIDGCPDKSYVKESEVETFERGNEIIPYCPECGLEATWTGYDDGLDWVIVGGESGPGARVCYVRWIQRIVRDCRRHQVPVFVKQLGAFCVDRNDAGFEGDGDDRWPAGTADKLVHDPYGYRVGAQGADVRIKLTDRAGADPAEWPEDLRVQEFPR